MSAASGCSDLAVYLSLEHGDETVEQLSGAHKLPHLKELVNAVELVCRKVVR